MRIALLVFAVIGAMTYFMPWPQFFGNGYFWTNLSGDENGHLELWRVRSFTSPALVFLVMGIAAVACIGLLVTRHKRALAFVPLLASTLVICSIIERLSDDSMSSIFRWGTGFWMAGSIAILEIILSIAVLKSPAPFAVPQVSAANTVSMQ